MPEPKTDLLRGTLELLILNAVSLEPLHGVGITRRIEQVTRGAFKVSFGSLFPSLHRMEERGWLNAEWRPSDNNRRAKFYRLTRTGRKQLRVEEREWNRVVEAMNAALCTTTRRRSRNSAPFEPSEQAAELVAKSLPAGRRLQSAR